MAGGLADRLRVESRPPTGLQNGKIQVAGSTNKSGDTDADTAEVTVDTTPQADLWGPVVVNRRATCYFSAERGTNNTGEITGAIQALLWLLHVAEDGDAAILCDSCYTMDALEERMEIKTNVKLVDAGRVLLAQVRASRTVTFIHVKGHSTARVHYTC